MKNKRLWLLMLVLGLVVVSLVSCIRFSSKPIAVTLVMDYSGSMYDQDVQNAQTAVLTFIDKMNEQDLAQIVKFADNIYVYPETHFVNKGTELVDYVNNGYADRGMTKLYGAILQAIENCKTQVNGADYTRAVIAFTDGYNNLDPYGDDGVNQVITAAKNEGIPVFTIGLGEYIEDITLKKIAADTGGEYYAAATSEDMNDIYEKLAVIIHEMAGYLF